MLEEEKNVISEPYRYKYENGEKKEDPNSSAYYRSPYDTYNYNTSFNYDTTASRGNTEVPEKKKKRRPKRRRVGGTSYFGAGEKDEESDKYRDLRR